MVETAVASAVGGALAGLVEDSRPSSQGEASDPSGGWGTLVAERGRDGTWVFARLRPAHDERDSHVAAHVGATRFVALSASRRMFACPSSQAPRARTPSADPPEAGSDASHRQHQR